MTPKQRVLKRHPFAHASNGMIRGYWRVFDTCQDKFWIILGRGKSAKDAWADATKYGKGRP